MTRTLLLYLNHSFLELIQYGTFKCTLHLSQINKNELCIKYWQSVVDYMYALIYLLIYEYNFVIFNIEMI